MPGKRRNSFIQDAIMLEMNQRDKDGDRRGVRRLAITLWDQAESGERWAAEFIRDTVDGKPIQAIEGDISHDLSDPLKELLGRIAGNGARLVATKDDAVE